MFLEQLNNRLAIKKQELLLQLISPLERISKSIKDDILVSNNYDYILKAGTKAGAAKRWAGHTHEQVLAAHGYTKNEGYIKNRNPNKDYYTTSDLGESVSGSTRKVRGAMNDSNGKANYVTQSTHNVAPKVNIHTVELETPHGHWENTANNKWKSGEDALSLGKHLDKLHGVENTDPKEFEPLDLHSLSKLLHVDSSNATPSKLHHSTRILALPENIAKEAAPALANYHHTLIAHGFTTKDHKNYEHPDGSRASLSTDKHEDFSTHVNLNINPAKEHQHLADINNAARTSHSTGEWSPSSDSLRNIKSITANSGGKDVDMNKLHTLLKDKGFTASNNEGDFTHSDGSKIHAEEHKSTSINYGGSVYLSIAKK